MRHQQVRLQRAALVGEQEHAAAGRSAESARHQFGVVGRPHHVQVGVVVQVGPGDRIGIVPSDELPRRNLPEGGRCETEIEAPQRRPVAGVGKHQVEPAVAVHVHRVDRAAAVHVQGLLAKLQAALVPEHGRRRVHARQRDVDAAVAVEIGQRNARPVGHEKHQLFLVAAGGMGQRVRNERARARAGARCKRLSRNVHRHHRRLRIPAGTRNQQDRRPSHNGDEGFADSLDNSLDRARTDRGRLCGAHYRQATACRRWYPGHVHRNRFDLRIRPFPYHPRHNSASTRHGIPWELGATSPRP